MSDSPRPNIIFVMTDQQRADFTRSEGFPLDTMPGLDAFGTRGYRFRRAYTSTPLCTPARCSLFTGKYPKAMGVRDNYQSGAHIRRSSPDLFDLLKEQGYSLHLCGKNHAYLQEEDCDTWSPYSHRGYQGKRPLTAEEQQFEDWLKALGNRVAEDANPLPAEVQQPHRIVNDAIEAVTNAAGNPFFLWLSFPEPHNPCQTSEPYFSLFDPDTIPARLAVGEDARAKGGKWRWMREAEELWRENVEDVVPRFRATYCGMIRQIDDEIARFLEHLEEQGLLESSLIVFLSDHGDYAFDYGLHGKGVGMPECLVRIPLVFWGPGVRADVVNETDFVSITDIMPTICDALDVEIPHGVQGRSLWPMLTGDDYPATEFRSAYAEVGVGDLHFEPDAPGDAPLHFDPQGNFFDGLNCVSMSGKLKMIRMDRWKLLFDMMGSGELYDVEADPGELKNLYDEPEMGAVRLGLMEELLKWTIRTEEDTPKGLYERRRDPHNWYWTE